MSRSRPKSFLFPRRSRSVAIFLGAGVAGLAAAFAFDHPLLSAADVSTSAIASPDTDTLVALNVRKALETNPDTAGLNFSISVTAGRETIIGGPISDAELTPKIEAIVKRVRGVGEVKVECWVPSKGDPLQSMVAERMGKPHVALPEATAAPIPAPTPNASQLPVDVSVPGRVTVQRAPAINGPFLLDPVGPGGVRVGIPGQDDVRKMQGAPERTIHGYPTIPPASVPTSPNVRLTSLGSGIDSLRESDRRFAEITVDLKDGTATLGGRVQKFSDIWDYSDGLRKFTGIERVVIGSVDVR